MRAVSMAVCGHSTAVYSCKRKGQGCLACGGLCVVILRKLELHSVTHYLHPHLSRHSLCADISYLSEGDNLGKYGSEQCETLWCLWGLNSRPGLNSLCKPWLLVKTKQNKNKTKQKNPQPSLSPCLQVHQNGKACPPIL